MTVIGQIKNVLANKELTKIKFFALSAKAGVPGLVIDGASPGGTVRQNSTLNL